MSLVASLFGQKDESTTTSLFDKTVEVPAPRLDFPSADNEDKETSNNEADRNGEQDEPPVEYGPAARPGTSSDNHQTEDEEKRTVFVGNLPLSFVQRKRKLDQIFQDCGKIQSSRLRSIATEGVKVPPQQAGNQNLVAKVSVNTNQINASAKKSITGYVVFADEASVELALEKNNLEISEGGERRHIRVDRVKPQYDASRSIFVGNLPYAADEEVLFRTFENVEAVRIVRDNQTHQCKGFGYVLFQDKAGAAAALQRKEVKFMGRILRIRVCGKRFKSQAERTVVPKPPRDNPVGALRRVLAKQAGEKKKRARGEKKSVFAVSSGKSKRAVAQAKESQRVKKLEKRMSKGMGKNRKK